MKKYYPLTLIAALVLSACGGSDSSDDNSSDSEFTLSGRALSGNYLAGQTVCLDLNADKSCNEGEPQTTTDNQGNFNFALPEAQKTEATQAWAIVTIPTTSSQVAARSSNKTSAPLTLLGYFDGSEFAISPYTDDLVSRTDSAQRETQYQSSIATKEKQTIASELDLSTQEASEQHLFGDYLAAGDEYSAALAEEAAIKEQQLSEAAELQAQLEAALAANNPNGWTKVEVNIRNLWSHSFHLKTIQHVRLEEVIYSKRVGSIETKYTKGTNWILDAEGAYNPELPQHHYTDETSKDWDAKTIQAAVTWEWDYDQDGSFNFKGESARRGTFSQNADGLYSYQLTEFYNEGDPASEGAASHPGRIYCENFDIQAEMTRWATDPRVAIDNCVGFVQTRDMQERLDAQGAWVATDAMTEWDNQNDDPGNENSGDSWYVNADTPANYHEPRTETVTAQGDVQYLTQRDWHALTINSPDLGQSPFNVTHDDRQLHDGGKVIQLDQPLWRYRSALDQSIAGFERVELQNYNPTRWGHYSDAYIEQDYQQQANGFTLQNRFFQQDERRPDGYAYPLNLKYAGNIEPFTTQDWQFDNTSQTLKIKHHYQSVTEEIGYVLPWPYNLIQGNPMDLEATIQLQQIGDLATATQAISVDGSEAIDTPTFAEAIFTSPLRWAIDNPSTDPEVQALVELLFGQAPFAFTANRDTSDKRQCEGGLSGTSVQQSLLFAPIGGDMVLNLTCHESDGNWIMGEYLLQITSPYNGATFQAVLLEFNQGSNIYRDEPSQRYPLTFIKQ